VGGADTTLSNPRPMIGVCGVATTDIGWDAGVGCVGVDDGADGPASNMPAPRWSAARWARSCCIVSKVRWQFCQWHTLRPAGGATAGVGTVATGAAAAGCCTWAMGIAASWPANAADMRSKYAGPVAAVVAAVEASGVACGSERPRGLPSGSLHTLAQHSNCILSATSFSLGN